jgi:lipopolysaccharide transport system ATP-binding protein
MKPIIEIKNVGKKYDIAHQRGGYVALRDILGNILRDPFRFVRHKAKQIAGLTTKEEFWALRDVSFEIKPGEIVGIIGANGAGKSTLLKLLSRITPPTTGEIRLHGRVTSLLEVGTGFHPELTGRENIFLNGAILGMTKKEMGEKFDEIVAFSGIEKFLDTPVKYYSSGMYVRLAFSVAAHMEPDILLVDEVLAVGDAEFQKKSLDKLNEIIQHPNRAVLFVSHNIAAIQSLCSKCVLLEKGRVKMIGDTKTVLDHYFSMQPSLATIDLARALQHDSAFKVLSFELLNGANNSFSLPWNRPLSLRLRIEIKEKIGSLSFAVGCATLANTLVFISRDTDQAGQTFHFDQPGIYEIETEIAHTLRAGKYYLSLGVTKNGRTAYFDPAQVVLEVIADDQKKYIHENRGVMNCVSVWNKINN